MLPSHYTGLHQPKNYKKTTKNYKNCYIARALHRTKPPKTYKNQ